jgi:hypothetical protein
VLETRNAYGIFAGKPLEKRSLERSRMRLWDKIKMVLNKVSCAGMSWMKFGE